MGETAIKPGKSVRRKWAWRLLRAFVVAYLLVTLAVFCMQGKLIFPGASSQGQANAMVPAGKHYELLSLRAADGVKIAAIFGRALDSTGEVRADAASRPTVIYFYGNGSCMAWSKDVFEDLRRHGFNVIVPDYEGYGMSAGSPSEAGCYATADAAYDYLLSRDDVDKNKIDVLGWSLGGAVAIDLANRKSIAAVATLSAFTSMDDMARDTVPWLPTSLILRSHFNNLAKISKLNCPLLIGHGMKDDLVPPAMADRLAAAAHGNITRVRVDGAGHNDIFDVGGDRLMDQLQTFFDGK
jgi:fermentation-respiration switch protein FrsA (DUF1100 family)